MRLLVPHRNRFLFEGCRLLPGQLWYADRALLFDSVRRYRPRFVFEVGTWKGGGSTLFIAQALFENGTGILHTIDVDPQLHAEATEGYRRHVPHLLPHVRFHLGASTEVYPEILQQIGHADCIFLDGLGAEQTLAEYQMFIPYLKPGALLIAHDWFDTKMSLVRPRIEAAPDWVVDRVITPPASVGIALSRRQ